MRRALLVCFGFLDGGCMTAIKEANGGAWVDYGYGEQLRQRGRELGRVQTLATFSPFR